MDHTEAAPVELHIDDEIDPEPAQEPEPTLDETPEYPQTPEYPDPPRTGDAAVDRVIDAVAHAVGGPLEEQLAVYDTAYRTLQGRLADVEG